MFHLCPGSVLFLDTALKINNAFFLAALLAAASDCAAPALGARPGENAEKSPPPHRSPRRSLGISSKRRWPRFSPAIPPKPKFESLLGRPWRETELDEEDVYPGSSSVEVWEYRGRDSHGTYRVHIEFDKNAVTTLIASIPDKTARAVARVVKPDANSAKQ